MFQDEEGSLRRVRWITRRHDGGIIGSHQHHGLSPFRSDFAAQSKGAGPVPVLTTNLKKCPRMEVVGCFEISNPSRYFQTTFTLAA